VLEFLIWQTRLFQFAPDTSHTPWRSDSRVQYCSITAPGQYKRQENSNYSSSRTTKKVWGCSGDSEECLPTEARDSAATIAVHMPELTVTMNRILTILSDLDDIWASVSKYRKQAYLEKPVLEVKSLNPMSAAMRTSAPKDITSAAGIVRLNEISQLFQR